MKIIKKKTIYNSIEDDKIKIAEYFYDKKGRINTVLFYYPESEKIERKDEVVHIGSMRICLHKYFFSISVQNSEKKYLKINRITTSIYWYNDKGNVAQEVYKDEDDTYISKYIYNRSGRLARKIEYKNNKYLSKTKYKYIEKGNKSVYYFESTTGRAGFCHIGKYGMVEDELINENINVIGAPRILNTYDDYDNLIIEEKESGENYYSKSITEIEYWE